MGIPKLRIALVICCFLVAVCWPLCLATVQISTGKIMKSKKACFGFSWIDVQSFWLGIFWAQRPTIDQHVRGKQIWSTFEYPRLPKSSKYLVSRCLEPLKPFSGDVWGFKNLYTHQVFGCLKIQSHQNSKHMLNALKLHKSPKQLRGSAYGESFFPRDLRANCGPVGRTRLHLMSHSISPSLILSDLEIRSVSHGIVALPKFI